MPKRKSQKDRYVTKVEFDEAIAIVNTSFEHVSTKEQVQQLSDQVNSRVDDVVETQQTILEIVKSIDENTKNIKGIPERVDKLEEDVFRLKLKQNLK